MTLCSGGFDLFNNGHIEYVPIEKDNGIQSLSLGGGRDLPIGSKVAQKGIDFSLPHVARVLLRAKLFDITDNPVAVGMFRTVGVMMVTQNLPDLVHELQARVRSEFPFVFHEINIIFSKHEKINGIISMFLLII
jgi:hypothetical protein